MKKLMVGAVAAVLALGAFNATAQLVLNLSGTVKNQNTVGQNSGAYVSKSINEKTVYTLISNAVANVEGYSIALSNLPVHLPANGYIAFNPESYDGGPEDGNGYFYVTNKTGYYFQLSGLDTNGTYYSFMELDSYVYYDDNDALALGFDDVFDDVASYNLNSSGNGSSTAVATAVLYIHDYPYDTDDADNPGVVFDDNDNLIEIRGILTLKVGLKEGDISSGSATLTGTGNFFLESLPYSGVVDTGTASFTK